MRVQVRLLRLGYVPFALALVLAPLAASDAGPAFAGAGEGVVRAVRTCDAALTLTVEELGDGTAVATLAAAPTKPTGGASAFTQCAGTTAIALAAGHAPVFVVEGSWARGFAGSGIGQAIAIGPYGTGDAIRVSACFGCPLSSYLTVSGTVADASHAAP